MKTYSDLVRQKQNLEEALVNINAALESEHYTAPFVHKVDKQLDANEFNHQIIKNVLGDCKNRLLGFDPDLFVTHVEKEVHAQFNALIEAAIKDRPIRFLLEAKHEMELFMLKERKEMYGKALCGIAGEIGVIEGALNTQDAHAELPVSVVIETPYVATAEDKINAIISLEQANPDILTDKDIKKIMKVPTKKKGKK
jgi:hypothetical protein